MVVSYALIQCKLGISYVAGLLGAICKHMAVIRADCAAVAHSHVGAVEVCATASSSVRKINANHDSHWHSH